MYLENSVLFKHDHIDRLHGYGPLKLRLVSQSD